MTTPGGLGSMHIHRDTTRWAEQMCGGCELGDARRTRRTVKLGAQLAAHAGQAPVVSELLLDTTTRLGRARWEEVMWQGWFRLQERVDTYLATRDFLDFPRHVHLPRGVEEDRLGVSRDDTH